MLSSDGGGMMQTVPHSLGGNVSAMDKKVDQCLGLKFGCKLQRECN